MIYINVLLPVATDGIYTYTSNREFSVGMRVSVPLGKRVLTGIVLEKTDKPTFDCREVCEALDEKPLFGDLWIKLIKYMSEYYSTPLGTTLHGVLSSKILNSKPLEKEYEIKYVPTKDVVLTKEQKEIVDAIDLSKYSSHLIYGVTGSGKTEIYLELAKKVINEGKKVLYLVPEIALTPQLEQRIAERLGYLPALFHSKLTDKKRTEAFWSFIKGDNNVLLGARSALFVPAKDIGLIIIDEEHENTYKQEEAPSYHLRDMAVLYASLNNIPVILGSATPQVESMYNCEKGKYVIHRLHSRMEGSELPKINIVDMKEKALAGGIMVDAMYDELYKTVENGKQAILFLNRKGYATSLFCRQCGAVQECVNCSVALTMYKNGRCICQYCGSEYKKIECTACGHTQITDSGAGTERVEEYIEQMFPNKSVRIDADSIKSMKQLNKLLSEFNDNKYQIMIGTQLIAKGLHFPNVTFVGIMGIDNILSMPDFRATEKAFQLMMQVSGRAGRGENKGTVYIQTLIPEHPVFDFVLNNPEDFYDYEYNKRKEFSYPPFIKMARIILSYSKEDILKAKALELINALNAQHSNIKILGPSPAVVYKIKNKYRYSVLIKALSNRALSEALVNLRNLFEKRKVGTMLMKVDRDPYFFM